MTISGPLSPWLAGNHSYTLTCVVIADVIPEVKWIDFTYNLEEKERLTLSGPVVSGSHTTLNLTFHSLRTSQAGRYSCVSKTDIPASLKSYDWNVTIQCESDKHK